MRTKTMFTMAVAAMALTVPASAQLTTTSPAGGTLPSGVTVVGGIVTDLRGANGNHVISQIAASGLYQGFASVNPFTIGSLSGFTPGVLGSLGGGLTSAAFRFTLYDGDNAPGDFDFDQNFLLVNDQAFAGNNWSQVVTQETTSSGATIGGTGLGFADERLMTGWFSSSDATFLNALFGSLSSSGALSFGMNDLDPGDNFYDFTLGLDASLINVGQGPVVTPTTVPEPTTVVLMATGLLGIAAVARRRRVRG